ncbi:MAG: 4-hydroxyphenylacetate 3-monooxygenase, oxygenase component, partial [SAR202 cluster bacterium]|nr:4-hydroxyphenylacetate 3-monooxygenase, oxygenase component [SAR202 cluster bacterium]
NQYLQTLRENSAEVWLEGERVPDVTSHPGLRRGAQSVASLYDLQLDPSVPDEMTYTSPTSGDPVGMSFIVPSALEDLENRRKMMTQWARTSGGMLGRTPDYLNVILMACAEASSFFGGNSPEFSQNAIDYYQHARENDLALTHTLINVRRTRSALGTTGTDEDVALHITEQRDDGIVVKGARVLATLGPLSDEIMVFPSTVLQTTEDAWRYAFAFCIPCNTPGLKFVCRESFDIGRSTFDHPLGSRFEEMDSIVVFDDVFVPWERVYLSGDIELCNTVFAATGSETHMMHQVITKNVVKSEFLLGVAGLMVESLGSGGIPQVQERVAELILDMGVMKACLRASEADARIDQWGVMSPDRDHLDVARNLFPRMYPRMTELIQLLGSSSLMMLPTEADFQSPIESEVNDILSTEDFTGLQRVKIFRLAWDIAASSFGSRQALYERFFFGDPTRRAISLYNSYDRQPVMDRVKEFLELG